MENNEEFISEENEEKNLIQEEYSIPKENLKWYVIHTYSGYENKVKANIEKIIENRNMYDVISEVVVPTDESFELTKAGEKKSVSKKIFPGYVFLKMIMNDDTWYVVRNTRGVTSFVGPGSKPVPLTEDEVLAMGIENFLNNRLDDEITTDIKEGDIVLIKSGSFTNSSGIVKKVNAKKKTLIVSVNFFGGRETPVELDFNQVQQMA